jgi:hypothetical protein
MKKFLVWATLVGALVWSGMTAARVAERYSSCSSDTLLPAGANDTANVIPSGFQGTFRPDKLQFEVFHDNSGTAQARFVIYFPPDTGPETATDSLSIIFVGSTDHDYWTRTHWGPFSDSMRAYINSNCSMAIITSWGE